MEFGRHLVWIPVISYTREGLGSVEKVVMEGKMVVDKLEGWVVDS